MSKKIFFSLFLILSSNTVVFGSSLDSIPFVDPIIDSLNNLGKVFLTSKDLNKRQMAEHQFSQYLNQALASENAFDKNFDSLKVAPHLISPDSTFKIFTWQLYVDEKTYSYGGLIQKQDGSIVKLEDKSQDYFSAEFENGSEQHWYGCIYYHIEPFLSKAGEQMYLLFGFDGNNLMERRKIIDVLKFEEGSIYFGQPVFLKTEHSQGHPPTKMRVILEYYAASSVKCNYDKGEDKILFDHLTFTKTPHGEYLIPDGTYEGYEYLDGVWYHVPKMFHEVLMEAPRPEPVLSNEGNPNYDIMGKDELRSRPDQDELLRKKKKKRNRKKKKKAKS